MPVKTQKQELIEYLALVGFSEIFCFDSVEKAYNICDQLSFLEIVRYIEERRPVPKSVHWLETILPNLDDKRFRVQIRMNRGAFLKLVQLLSETFLQSGYQEPLPVQLAVAVHNLGTSGNGSSVELIAGKFGISYGSVINFTSRIIEALTAISSEWIKWPTVEERREISNAMLDKALPKCIGFVDGSHVPFFKAPSEEKEAYWSRKKEYAMQFQVVCDPQRQIRHLFVGYPASVHDAKVFSATEISKNPDNYFSLGEYLIGDTAYSKSETMIVPYKRRQGYLTPVQRKFNKHVSSHRVTVEHTIGLLKGRFQSLKNIRIQIDNKGHKCCCQWIKACAVLHNFLSRTDPWTQESDEIYLDPEVIPDGVDNINDERQDCGELKRTALCEIILEMI